jgi:hypothetical protein
MWGALYDERRSLSCQFTTKKKTLVFINPVRTSQETHHVSTTKPNRLMLFGETVAVYCENHTEHTDTLCGQNAEFFSVKVSGIYSYRYAIMC